MSTEERDGVELVTDESRLNDEIQALRGLHRFAKGYHSRGYWIEGGEHDKAEPGKLWTVTIWSKRPDGSMRDHFPVKTESDSLLSAVKCCFHELYHRRASVREQASRLSVS